MTHYRVDEDHSNAFSLWKQMGSPQAPSEQQYMELEREGMLEMLSEPHDIAVDRGRSTIEFILPRAAVSLLIVEFGR
jgi:xylan 1,4-beta-xylosidase